MKIGKINIPIFAIIGAIPTAIRKARETAADDHATNSPGGSKVTAGEVTEAVLAFIGALGEAIMEPVLKANGLSA